MSECSALPRAVAVLKNSNHVTFENLKRIQWHKLTYIIVNIQKYFNYDEKFEECYSINR